MFKRAPACLLLALAITAGGCTGLGLAPPQSFNDRVAYALSSHTAALEATTRALDFEEISSGEAEDMLAIADRSRELIDTARRVQAAGDLEGADRTLALATAILQELQTYLRTRGASP